VSTLRIGVVPFFTGWGGGIYHVGLNVLRALQESNSEGCQDEFILFAEGCMPGWEVKPLRPPSAKRRLINSVRQAVGDGSHREAWRWLRRRWQCVKREELPDPERVRFNPEIDRWLRQCGVDLMLYMAPTTLCFEVGIPYITFVPDLRHRLHLNFAEVFGVGACDDSSAWETREYLFRNAIRSATLVLVDSETGKDDVLFFYGSHGATLDRIKVLPYPPPTYLHTDVSEEDKHRVQCKYKLPRRYLFYPAHQLYPHKNVDVIIQALERLRRFQRVEIPVVLCGLCPTDDVGSRYFRLVMNMARYCGVEDQFRYLGYVPDEDLSALYAGAAALVMPTFLGPANVPYLEAWAIGCPVLTSDIRGIREQVGDAALLVDPRSTPDMASAIYRLWWDENLRRTLAERGRQRTTSYTFDAFRDRLLEILQEGKERLRSDGAR
jgi:glycosyltransferase involved in cell wall biosynthesis